MLKRSIARLIIDIGHGNVERASARIKYMNELLLPRCYRCVTSVDYASAVCWTLMWCRVFTQIVNDNQFSALGLTLVAELARIQRIIGIEDGAVEEPGNLGVRSTSDSNKALTEAFEDLGEVVAKPVTSRADVDIGPHLPAAGNLPELLDSGDGRGTLEGPEADVVGVGPDPRLRDKGKETSAAKEKRILKNPSKRQRRKSTNIIDDLFQELE